MKVAIMTWFHYQNYGTALQVTALTKFLKDHGYTPDVINYIPKGIRSRTVPDYTLSSLTKRTLNQIGSKKYGTPSNNTHITDERVCRLFDQFIKDNLELTKTCITYSDLYKLNKHYDYFICGSDQIWSPNNFDPHYFLDFVYPVQKRIAFSPSIGLERIDDPYLVNQYKKLIEEFACISIREKHGKDLIKKITGIEVPVTCDPTMLIPADHWRTFQKSDFNPGSGPYVLAYILGNNHNHWNSIYDFISETGLNLKIVPVYETDLDREGVLSDPIGPAEFLKLIDNASFVVTDSFHGMVFSLLFHTQFIPFERFSPIDPINQNSRVYNLLEQVNLLDNLIKFDSSSKIQISEIDFMKTDELIDKWRIKSRNFLLKSLNEPNNQNFGLHNKSVDPSENSCSGCGICSKACPVDAIKIRMNQNGFLQAEVNQDLCINCGKCSNHCPFYSDPNSSGYECARLFSYKDNRSEILNRSSSGGAAFALSELLLNQGYRVIGSTFNEAKQAAEHICIDSIESLSKLQGSKYLQSDFSKVLNEVQNTEKPIVIFGLPCQIAASRKLLKDRSDVYYVDLICHGVPSYNLYKKYKKWIASNSDVNSDEMITNFRSKESGWKFRTVRNTDGKNTIAFDQNTDGFFRMFESMNCYNDSCYECPWRKDSSADLRLGDYWGPRFENDTTGVSMLVSYNQSGEQLIELLTSSGLGNCSEHPKEDYIKYQQTFNFPKPLFYDELMLNLRSESDNLDILNEKYSYPGEKQTLTHIGKLERIIRMIRYDQFDKELEKEE